MPTYLLILISILVSLAIIATFYAIISYRRMGIAYRKIDYLVEDLTYKTEMLSPTFETIARISTYVDTIEALTKRNSTSINKLISKNKKSIKVISDKLKEIVDGE